MIWYRIARFVQRVADAACRHPEGMVCAHRQYEYDLRLRGYTEGMRMGRQNTEAKWRGSLTGVGPYADYPAPKSGAVECPICGDGFDNHDHIAHEKVRASAVDSLSTDTREEPIDA